MTPPIKNILAVLSASFAVSMLGAIAVYAQEYQPLAPLPGLKDGAEVDFVTYAGAAISFVIGFSAVLAVLVLVYGGFMYMTGEAINTKKEGADTMKNAVYGLLLILASWIILNTINPNLLNLNLNVCKVGDINCAGSGTPTGGTNGTPTGGTGNPPATEGQNVVYYSDVYKKNLTCVDCVPLTGVSIKPGQCEGETCRTNESLAKKLQLLNAKQSGWRVTEAWPPTAPHKNICHQNGSCVDINFIDSIPKGTLQDQAQRINTLIGKSAGTGFGSNAFVYEVATQERYDDLKEAGVDPTNLLVVSSISAEHFSVYNK